MKNRSTKEFIDLIDMATRWGLAYSDPNIGFVLCEFEIFRNIEDVIVDNRFLTMSASSISLWGYKPEEMIGRSYKAFCHPDDILSSEDAVAGNIKNQGALIRFPNRYFHKDGRIINNFWWTTIPVNDRFSCFCVLQ